jgi:hypothetical protein
VTFDKAGVAAQGFHRPDGGIEALYVTDLKHEVVSFGYAYQFLCLLYVVCDGFFYQAVYIVFQEVFGYFEMLLGGDGYACRVYLSHQLAVIGVGRAFVMSGDLLGASFINIADASQFGSPKARIYPCVMPAQMAYAYNTNPDLVHNANILSEAWTKVKAYDIINS